MSEPVYSEQELAEHLGRTLARSRALRRRRAAGRFGVSTGVVLLALGVSLAVWLPS